MLRHFEYVRKRLTLRQTKKYSPPRHWEQIYIVQNECRWKMMLENVGFSTWGEKISWGGNPFYFGARNMLSCAATKRGPWTPQNERSQANVQFSTKPSAASARERTKSTAIARNRRTRSSIDRKVSACRGSSVEVGPDNFGTAKSPTLHLLQVLKKVSETRGLIYQLNAEMIPAQTPSPPPEMLKKNVWSPKASLRYKKYNIYLYIILYILYL